MRELVEFTSSVVERGKKEGCIRADIPTEDIVYCYGGMVMNTTRVLFHPRRGERFDPACKARAITSILLDGVRPEGRPVAVVCEKDSLGGGDDGNRS